MATAYTNKLASLDAVQDRAAKQTMRGLLASLERLTGDLGGVAFTNDYNSLINKPTIPSAIFSTIAVAGQSNVVADSATDTLTFVAGTGMSLVTDAATDTITFASTALAFKTIAVAGQSDVVADSVADTLTLVAGTGVTITTNAATDTITIAASGGSGDVVGPAGATDNAVCRFDLATGKLIQSNAGVTIDDTGMLSQTVSIDGVNGITVTNSNAGVNAAVQFRASNGSDVCVFGINGTAKATYGAMLASEAFLYASGSRNITIMSDGPAGVIKFATGGNVEHARLDAAGQFTLPTMGSTGGVRIGGDVDLYRSAANVATMPDTLLCTGTAHPGVATSGAYMANASGGWLGLVDASRAANDKLACAYFGGGVFHMSVVNDAISASTDFMKATGGQATGVTSVEFPAGTHIFSVDRQLRFNNHTSAAGVAVGTLNNAPTAGNPGFWLKINVAGVNYALPAWAG